MATIGVAAYPTPDDVLQTMLRTLRLGYQRAGIAVNVLPGSEHYKRCEAIAGRVSIAIANGKIARADFSPLTATGDALDAICRVFGVRRRAANGAAGYVQIGTTPASATITIPISFRGTSATGKKYDTTITNLAITDGAKIEIRATSTGADTDLAAGAKITWSDSAIGQLKTQATVAAGGLTGGSDADTDEVLRSRLIDRISFPSAGGNVAFVKEKAEAASSAVEKAYVYAGLRGSGSCDAAVTSTAADRTLSSANVGTVLSAVVGNMPGGVVDFNVTTVTAEGVDVLLNAKLPSPANAGGAGNGWRDATPWPSGSATIGADDGYVTAYNSVTTIATVRTTATPVVGQHIGIWNPVGESADGVLAGAMNEYEINYVAGGVGAWTIKVTGGFKVSPLHAYVSTGAVYLADYANEFLAQMRILGPGEKTANVDLLPRARRQLGSDVANPSGVTTRILTAVQAAHPEISELTYNYRVATGTSGALTEPSIPSTTALPPNVLVLSNFALWKA